MRNIAQWTCVQHVRVNTINKHLYTRILRSN